jgi:hypothetical protein
VQSILEFEQDLEKFALCHGHRNDGSPFKIPPKTGKAEQN